MLHSVIHETPEYVTIDVFPYHGNNDGKHRRINFIVHLADCELLGNKKGQIGVNWPALGTQDAEATLLFAKALQQGVAQARRILNKKPRITAQQKNEKAIAQQKKWIKEHGGDAAGYIKTYGSTWDPNHTGDGGELIYEADLAELRRLENKFHTR